MEKAKEMKFAWSRLGVLSRNVKRFRGGLVFKAHRLLYDPNLGLRVIKKKVWAFLEPFLYYSRYRSLSLESIQVLKPRRPLTR